MTQIRTHIAELQRESAAARAKVEAEQKVRDAATAREGWKRAAARVSTKLGTTGEPTKATDGNNGWGAVVSRINAARGMGGV